MATRKKPKVTDTYLQNIEKPLWKLTKGQLRQILDDNWFPRANEALENQRKIWDYSYLSYKGIVMQDEINRTRKANKFGIHVNVPRTYMTIEGIRRNFNISKLRVHLEPIPGITDLKRKNIGTFLNYDLRRGKTYEQVKDAGFNKLLFGNGFLYTYLAERVGKYGNIVGDIIETGNKSGYVKSRLDTKKTRKYFGMVARSVSPYKVFNDPDGVVLDYNDVANKPCNFHCLRDVKHINQFKRDWRGIVPDKLLDEVMPGGEDMTNYEAIRETIDYLFQGDTMKYPGTVSDVIGNSKVVTEYNQEEFVEERLWLGEDFFILQAGKGLKFLIISPNLNPNKDINLTKLDDVKIPGEYHAMGEAWIQRYQQVEENRIHNYSLDTLYHGISGMLGINAQYLEDEFDLDIYPQKVWKFKPMPGVKMDEMIQQFQPSTGGVSAAMKFMEEVKNISQSTTSITDFVTGASKSIADSATEANKLAGASDLAIADKVKEMANIALTDVAKHFLSMYQDAYDKEEFKSAKIYFLGKTLESVSGKNDKTIEKILKKGFSANQIIFKDDLNITEPSFYTTGDVSLDRNAKFAQWVSAINFSKSINEVSFATGDTRRMDVIKMGKMALENFDVIGNPDEFEMSDQKTKLDEIKLSAELGVGVGQGEGGGQPKKNKITKPQSESSRTRQTAQPKNTGKNENTNKNK